MIFRANDANSHIRGPHRAVLNLWAVWLIAALTIGCGDPLGAAQKALEEGGYEGVEVSQEDGKRGVQFKGTKSGVPCTGTVIMIRSMADIEAQCAAPAGKEVADAVASPLAKAEAECKEAKAPACFEFGRLLVEGSPGERDLPKARVIHAENCNKRGNLDSCDALGYLHARAIGGAQDQPKAEAIFTAACEKGHAGACSNFGRLAFVDQRYKEARAMFEKGCKGKSLVGCNGLGTLLKQGKGGKEDMEAARKLFGDACDVGFQPACSNLGTMLAQGQGGDKDLEAAKAFLEKACKANVHVACHQLKKLGLK